MRPQHLVEQADALDHLDDVDRREPDGNHQPGDEPEVEHRGRPTAPPAERISRPSIRSAGRRRSRCPSRACCCGTSAESAPLEHRAVSVERALLRQARRRREDLALRLERVDDEDPDRTEHDERPRGQDQVGQAAGLGSRLVPILAGQPQHRRRPRSTGSGRSWWRSPRRGRHWAVPSEARRRCRCGRRTSPAGPSHPAARRGCWPCRR